MPSLLLSCSLAGEQESACSARELGSTSLQREPIVGGETEADYLALSPDERGAILAIGAARSGGLPHCSGVLIARDLVLTAAHCVADRPSGSILVGTPDAGDVPVVDISVNPSLDLALLTLEGAFVGVPIRVADEDASAWLGRRATLAGFGLNDSIPSAQRLFSTQQVTSVDDVYLTTSGFGLSGACLGDSGGPLLGRSLAGHVAVLGILSHGSATCVGEDYYLRTDSTAAADWLGERVGAAAEEDAACGTLTFQGRCFDRAAIWCDGDGVRRVDPCDDTKPCGWSGEARAYRCVEPTRDCAGADAVGACVDGSVRRCAEGIDEYTACDACQRCGFDSRTGRASCFPR